jgi:hypothetical protein
MQMSSARAVFSDCIRELRSALRTEFETYVVVLRSTLRPFVLASTRDAAYLGSLETSPMEPSRAVMLPLAHVCRRSQMPFEFGALSRCSSVAQLGHTKPPHSTAAAQSYRE